MSTDGFNFEEGDTPQAFIQWKGTDVCVDFYCECGAHCHFDGYFAHVLKCPHCETKWEMPHTVFPRRAAADSMRDAQLMEPDED